MSLARLALRLATIEALAPWAAYATNAWPTPAGSRVYDSRQQAIDALSDLETKPILIVYTEDDTNEPYGTAKTPDDETVHLVIEAMLAVRGAVDIDKPDGTGTVTIGTLDVPVSDPQQEALVDLLEAAVRRLLDTRNRAPSSTLFGKVALQVLRIESQPQRADDKTIRLLWRTLKFRVKVRSDSWPALPNGAPGQLPEPLATIAAGLDPASDGAAICATMTGLVQALQPAPLVPLESIHVTTDVDRDPTNRFPTQVRSAVAITPKT